MTQSKLVKVNNEKSYKYQGKNISKKKYTKKKGKIVSSANKGGADGTAEERVVLNTANVIQPLFFMDNPNLLVYITKLIRSTTSK